MVPYQLTLHNFMCYRGEQPPLQFDGLHVTCLAGDNGAGKSALLDAITWALFGKARMSDDDLIAQGEAEMLVDLVFRLNAQEYRVIRRRQRSRSKRGSGKSTIELQVHDPGIGSDSGSGSTSSTNGSSQWRAIGGHTVRETEGMIEDLLRMRYETFINASFLLQGRADEFTRKTAGERKHVLADILDLRDYATLEERARARMKKLRDQASGLESIIEHLQEEARKVPVYERMVSDIQARVETLATGLEQAEQEKSEADAQVRALEEKHARLKEKRERITTIRQQEQEQHDEIDRLHSDIAHAETLLQRREEILAGVQQLEAARTSLAHIESLRPRYDELSEAYRQLQDRLKDEQRRVQSDLDGHRRESQRIQQQLARRPALVAQREKLEQHLAALAPLADERAQVDEQRVELDERLSQANQLLLQRSEHLSTISEAYNALEATRKEQQRLITRLERQMSDVSRWRSELEEAQQHQQRVQELGNSLAELRQHEQSAAERAGELRAQCTQFKQQADDIKKRQALLEDTTTTTCPLCGSNLGEDGTATIAAHYESEIGHLREQYRLSQKEAQKHEADIKHLRDEIASQQTDLAQAQHHAARIDTLRQQLEQARGWQDELAQAQQTLEHTSKQLADDDYAREAREALLTLEETLLALGAEKSRKKSKKGEQTVFLTTALEAERTRLKQRATELERQLDTRTSIESEAATVRHQFDALQHDENSLPALEQQIAHLEQVIEQGDFGHELRVQASEVEAQIAQLGYTNEAHAAARDSVRQLSHWSEEQQKLMVAENTLDRDRRAVQRASELLERYTAEREQLASDVVELEQQVKALPDVQKHAAACDEQVKARREELDSSRNDLSEKQTLYKNAQQKAAQLETKQAERATVAEQQDIFRELAEACGKKGVQAMLIETAIPEIEREANRLLGRITDNQMHVTLDMQRSTKKGDTVETLDIKIADALGTRTYDAFSGGEAMRINFALRVALSRLLARRAGASLETLVIDEGFGMLDAEGRERFVEAITSVQQDFRRILVITHIDDLKDRFPAQIQITKTPTGSVFEIV